MALFDNKPEETVEESTNFKFGEEGYTREQLEELVGFGKLAKEAETRYNTKIDRVYPEFTKKSQQVKEYEEKMSEYEEKIKGYESRFNQPTNEGDEIRQAKEAAKKLGLLTREDIEELGLVTKDKFGTQYNEIRKAERLLDDMTKYSNETNGSDGRPKFDIDSMLSYMQDTGIQDFKAAYKVRYDDELSEWKDKQLSKAKRPGLYTEESSTYGDKMPREEKVTRDTLHDSIRQALEGRL